MHLVIRVTQEEQAIALKGAFEGSLHVVVLEPVNGVTPLPTDAEFLTMGMAEALGLSPSVQPFQVVIADAPPDAAWLPARLVITGITTDRPYDKREELQILLWHLWQEAARFNASGENQINSIGIRLDLLNVLALPVTEVANSILETIGPGV